MPILIQSSGSNIQGTGSHGLILSEILERNPLLIVKKLERDVLETEAFNFKSHAT